MHSTKQLEAILVPLYIQWLSILNLVNLMGTFQLMLLASETLYCSAVRYSPGGTFWESLKYITEVVPSHIDLACELIWLSLLVILYLSSGLKFW